MDEENHYLIIKCYSEKTCDFIGCGAYVHSMYPSPTDYSIVGITEALEESFWELLCDFEGSAQKAFDEGIITGTDRNELFKVFGHFHFSFTVDDKPVDIDLGFAPDDYMYPRLEEYLELTEQ